MKGIVTGAKEERGVYVLSENFDTESLILMPKFQGGVAVEALAAQEIKVVVTGTAPDRSRTWSRSCQARAASINGRVSLTDERG